MAKAEVRIQWFSEAGFSLRANRADWSGDAYGPPEKLKKNKISFRFDNFPTRLLQNSTQSEAQI
jgi:hypothetical protein